MLTVTDVELRVGARLLMDEVNFRVDKGDKVGLVGRNGAGKTTLTKVLAGGGQPTAGTVTRTGRIGYLPQDPKVEDMDQSGRDRILSARDLDQTIRRMREAEAGMAAVDDAERERAMNRYSRLEAEFEARGGYAAESEAARITSNLGLPDRVLDQPLHTLSGGQRRRVELGRILFSDADIMLLDEPTNHLDHDSIVWLRDYLKTYSGGLLMISHDVELMEMTVNKVLYLDANRQTMDVYNMTWKNYLAQRQQDEARRRREFANAEKKASALMAQAEKMRAKATKATAAQNMIKRAERLMRGVEGERAVDRVAAIRFPTPQASGKTPLRAENLSKSYGSLEIFTGVDLAIDRGSRVVILGYNGAGKTTLLRMLAGEETPDTGEVQAGHGLKLGYFAQEHDTLDQDASVLDNMRHAAPQLGDTQARTLLGSFLFQGDDVDKPARVLSGGEKTRLALATLVASSANVLLLDEPTNNLDPASREEILNALHQYEGAVVLVTHDEGAVEALDPERVVLLPDGVEDLWNDDYRDLITLA
ncbi:ATP-binding cassette domain-containing protein [Micrococcus luteus]|uniref:ribosomal protection-like ABC-F family protein n=1 Tax=Micrococcus TaxID=1269 RepID=UPI000763AAC6|nr:MULTISPECIES: ABC-F family ATP-binding cassette domain-containing protein [Micrococcus]KWW41246.1 putative ABC transporter ATP-binding protein YheS [Micrococcus luteus]MBN6750699.1 ABC-F family ATP-binding cassette domain-containing protein [Micrococcus luteus]MBN6759353.1 ABC-F family ATP-binding cassette domain-containing protein [Micrococcus luteus]MBN6766899.1 ABC-F family ATP-binding cassette domain-containing protein [Micrococcus luteus]MBN6800366.1 ABC-F family ATP-binding cassette d